MPPPKGDRNAPLKALIFDSWYDSYRGVIVLFRIIDGTIKKGTKIKFFNTGREYLVETIGVNRPRPTPINELGAGEVGFLTASIKTVADVQIGDTITDAARPVDGAASRVSGSKADGLRRALSDRLGPVRRPSRRDGKAAAERRVVLFRAGIVDRTRLRFPLRLSRPAAHGDHPGAARTRIQPRTDHDRARRALPRYDDRRRGRRDRFARRKCPTPAASSKIEEPFIEATILTNDAFLGGILPLLDEKRGVQKKFEYVTTDRVMLVYELPLNEIVLDFYDRLKIGFEGLRVARLSSVRLSGKQARQARRSRFGRAGRCSFAHSALATPPPQRAAF